MSVPLAAECSLPCTSCGAAAGAACRSRAGRPVPPHSPRVRALPGLPQVRPGTRMDAAVRAAAEWTQLRGTHDSYGAVRLPWALGGRLSRDGERLLPTPCHLVDAHQHHAQAETALALAGYVVTDAWLDAERLTWQRWALALNNAQTQRAYDLRRKP